MVRCVLLFNLCSVPTKQILKNFKFLRSIKHPFNMSYLPISVLQLCDLSVCRPAKNHQLCSHCLETQTAGEISNNDIQEGANCS